MSRDGFGDQLSVAELIEQHDKWLASTARFLLPANDPDVEDLEQEGRIAMWKAVGSHDPSRGHPERDTTGGGPLTMWMRANARWRMKEVRSNRCWTGHDSSTRPTLGGHAPRITSVHYLSELFDNQDAMANLLEAADLMQGVEMAYHRGEIAEAMSSLSPRQREYVYLRFWQGYNTGDLTRHFGYDPTTGMWSGKEAARGKLRRELAHLSSV